MLGLPLLFAKAGFKIQGTGKSYSKMLDKFRASLHCSLPCIKTTPSVPLYVSFFHSFIFLSLSYALGWKVWTPIFHITLVWTWVFMPELVCWFDIDPNFFWHDCFWVVELNNWHRTRRKENYLCLQSCVECAKVRYCHAERVIEENYLFFFLQLGQII